ncbi:MAG: alanine:cation symporter family protein, partial [Mogibacterium sp.]|nr:alanine:cation symporter family protein [Mogibacterium sp.]
YRWLYVAAVAIGPFLPLAVVWDFADLMNGLMAFPNLVALFALSGVVAKETFDFWQRRQSGEYKDNLPEKKAK